MMEQRKHSELRATAEVVCDALKAMQVGPETSSLQSCLGATFEQVWTQVKEALPLSMRRAFAIFRSHY
jgi:hypothetical protein